MDGATATYFTGKNIILIALIKQVFIFHPQQMKTSVVYVTLLSCTSPCRLFTQLQYDHRFSWMQVYRLCRTESPCGPSLPWIVTQA